MAFSHQFARGGFIIDGLVLVACETVVVAPFEKLGQSLDTAECRNAARQIEAELAQERGSGLADHPLAVRSLGPVPEKTRDGHLAEGLE